jgi:mycothiol system anti-sigma-R factor
MIGCSEATKRLWEYLDTNVDRATREAIEEHLDRCRRCCGELEFAKEMRGFLARSAQGDLPLDVLQRLNATVEEWGR